MTAARPENPNHDTSTPHVRVRAVLHHQDDAEVEFTGNSSLPAALVACRVTESRRDRGSWWVPRAHANDVVRALREPEPAASKEVE